MPHATLPVRMERPAADRIVAFALARAVRSGRLISPQKIDGFTPAIFIYLRFSRVGLRCDFYSGSRALPRGPLETRLLLLAILETRLPIHVRAHDLHEALGMRKRLETESSIQHLRITRDEHEAPQSGKRRVREHHVDQPLAEAVAARFGNDEHVGQIGERRGIRDHARKPDQRTALEERETERTCKG